MVRRLFLLFSVDIVVDGQPPCWSPFVVAIVIVAWLRTLSLSLDDIQYTRHTVQTLYLFLTTRGYARFLLLMRSYVRSSIFDDAWLRTLSIV